MVKNKEWRGIKDDMNSIGSMFLLSTKNIKTEKPCQ